jgi:hypothetical protein
MTAPFIDHSLTEREKSLVWQVNMDLDMRPDGVFRIDRESFHCDSCGSRIPHNGKRDDDNVADYYMSGDGAGDDVLCRLCADGLPDDSQTGQGIPADPRLLKAIYGTTTLHDTIGERDRISGRGCGEGS